MKRSSWSLAGGPVLVIAIVSGPGFALDAEKSADRGCVGAQGLPDRAIVEEESPGARVSGETPERNAFFLASPGELKKSPYFSIDKRHRPAWWRSASSGLRGH